jgi:hypothetical protein
MINIKDKTTSSSLHISNTGDIGDYITKNQFELELGSAMVKIQSFVPAEQVNQALQQIQDNLKEISKEI